MRSPRFLVAIGALVVAMALAACTDDSPGATDTATPAGTATGTTTATATRTSTATTGNPTASVTTTGTATTGNVTIDMIDNAFQGDDDDGSSGTQLQIEIEAGPVVVVGTNTGQVVHNLHVLGTGVDLVTDPLQPGDQYRLDLGTLQPGEYSFICDFHPAEMIGKIIVE